MTGVRRFHVFLTCSARLMFAWLTIRHVGEGTFLDDQVDQLQNLRVAPWCSACRCMLWSNTLLLSADWSLRRWPCVASNNRASCGSRDWPSP
jgi:hypothetical protein